MLALVDLENWLDAHVHDPLGEQLVAKLSTQLDIDLYNDLAGQLVDQFEDQLVNYLSRKLAGELYGKLQIVVITFDKLKLSDSTSLNIGRQLDNQLARQMFSKLDAKLRDGHGAELYHQLYDELEWPLSKQLRDVDNDYLEGRLCVAVC